LIEEPEENLMIALPCHVNTVLRMLGDAGFEACVVGGAVRDAIRGVPPKDWDVTTNALPAQVQAVFADYRRIETGIRHGTVTVLVDREPIEITTYRVDGAYTDHRRPDSVRFTPSLREDLLRRDFTINALAYSPAAGIVDVVGGLDDLKNGLVRCVGDPDRRFGEDGLRILRAIRFASTFGMKLEPATAAAVHRNRALLTSIAAERIRSELTKLLCGQDAAAILEEFADVIAVPIPEIAPMIGFDQKNPHHDRDVWRHTAAAVAAAPADEILRVAALLHDVGKPSCFAQGEDGVGHFYGHAKQSVRLADSILRRLCFGTATREQIVTLIRFHDMPLTVDKKAIRRLMSRLGADTVRQLIELHEADTRGQSAICRPRLAEYARVRAVLEELLREEACFSLRDLAVNGSDMIALGLSGKTIGAALHACLDAVMEEKLPNDRTQLLAFARETFA
jgi:tRNA nucleotidyltransferase (CCA-adding enzyme)